MNIANATAKRKFLAWLRGLNTSRSPGQPPKSVIIVVVAALVLYCVALAAITTFLK